MGYVLEGIQRKPTSPRRLGLRLWRRAFQVELSSCTRIIRLVGSPTAKKCPRGRSRQNLPILSTQGGAENKETRTARDGGPGGVAGTGGSSGVWKTQFEFDASNSTGNNTPTQLVAASIATRLWRVSASSSLSIMRIMGSLSGLSGEKCSGYSSLVLER
ncbi:MAG: hypothetical protein KAU17_13580 [Spirochaetales bacterium]|nr:hypothetical protein [Spirochaetales bacterium]